MKQQITNMLKIEAKLAQSAYFDVKMYDFYMNNIFNEQSNDVKMDIDTLDSILKYYGKLNILNKNQS